MNCMLNLCVCALCLADVSGVDWMVRHGRSLALAIAVKSAPGRLCGKEYCDSVTETILANATADRVRRASLWLMRWCTWLSQNILSESPCAVTVALFKMHHEGRRIRTADFTSDIY